LLQSASKGKGGGSIATIRLSNFKASESEARGDVAPESSQCCFVQAYYQLRDVPTAALRSIRDASQEKVFEVQFEGESGIDAGGVYREGLQRMIDDLHSDRFALMLRCGNAQKGYKVNTNSYVPNPTARSPLALSMFEFVGKLMGLSLRTKACLPFTFPSLVWKALVGDRPRREDLAQMDAMYAQFLASLRSCHLDVDEDGEPQEAITSEEAFAAAFPDQRFVTYNTAGVEVELIPGGRDVPVTFANRGRFAEAAEAARLHEFDTQLAAMRRGLATMVPVRATLQNNSWIADCDYILRHCRSAPYHCLRGKRRRYWWRGARMLTWRC
jgi:hypothetical protein